MSTSISRSFIRASGMKTRKKVKPPKKVKSVKPKTIRRLRNTSLRQP